VTVNLLLGSSSNPNEMTDAYRFNCTFLRVVEMINKLLQLSSLITRAVDNSRMG